MIPAWYGAGTAFETFAGADDRRVELLREMYASWPFFRTIIDNMGMVLAKTDIDIGRRYADVLVDRRRRCGATSSDGSKTSTASTREWHERITGSPDPLRDNPLLARSLRNRYPYLDPLHVMQVDLLRRHRDSDPDADGLDLVAARHPADDQRDRHRHPQLGLNPSSGAAIIGIVG